MGASTLPSREYNLSTHAEVFKDFYLPMAEAAMAAGTPYLSTVSQVQDFHGKAAIGLVRLSKGKGFGGLTIPQASSGKYADLTYDVVPLWIRSVLDYESILAAGDDKGAFFRVTSQEIADCLESFTESLSILTLGKGDGDIGTVSSVTGTDEPFTVVISDATWFEPYYEEGMVVNFGSDTTPFVITDVNPGSKSIEVKYHPDATTKTYDPAGTNHIYLQNMKNAGYIGLETVADTTDNGSNTLYGQTVSRRWEAFRYDAAESPPCPELFIEVASKMYEKTKTLPSHCWVAPSVSMSLEQQMEGKLEWIRQTPSDNRFAEFGWDAIGIRTKYGKVPISTDRFIKSGRAFFTQSRMTKISQRPGWGWVEDIDKGAKYLRNFTVGSVPKAEALYGGYAQFYHHPGFLGTITGMANTDITS